MSTPNMKVRELYFPMLRSRSSLTYTRSALHATPRRPVPHTQYLSSEQQIGDLTNFIAWIRKRYGLTDRNRWISFGVTDLLLCCTVLSAVLFLPMLLCHRSLPLLSTHKH